MREGKVKGRERRRDEVVGWREEEDEEGRRREGRLGCQPSKQTRRKEGQVLVVGMCRPWFQGPGSWWGL